MKEQVKEVVLDFVRDPTPAKFGNVILNLQESESISEKTQFRNCLRALRNIAAHMPYVIKECLEDPHYMCSRHVKFQRVDNDTVVLDFYQFAAWIMDIYKTTGEYVYVQFLIAVYRMRYSALMSRIEHGAKMSLRLRGEVGLALAYSEWLAQMTKEGIVIQPILFDDPYIVKLYNENIRMFWKLAIPDPMLFTCFFLSGRVNLEDMENVKYFITLFITREGV